MKRTTCLIILAGREEPRILLSIDCPPYSPRKNRILSSNGFWTVSPLTGVNGIILVHWKGQLKASVNLLYKRDKLLTKSNSNGPVTMSTFEYEASVSDISDSDRRTVCDSPGGFASTSHAAQANSVVDNQVVEGPATPTIVDPQEERLKFKHFPRGLKLCILEWRKAHNFERPSFVFTAKLQLWQTDRVERAYWVREDPETRELEGIHVYEIDWPEPKEKKREYRPRAIIGRAMRGESILKDTFIIGRNTSEDEGDSRDVLRNTFSEWVGMGRNGLSFNGQSINAEGYQRPLHTIRKHSDYGRPSFKRKLEKESRKLLDSTESQQGQDQSSTNLSVEPSKKRRRGDSDQTERVAATSRSALPTRPLNRAVSSEINDLDSNEGSEPDHRLLDTHMKTHLSIGFGNGNDGQPILKKFEFDDDDARSMLKLRTAALVAGLFDSGNQRSGPPLLSFRIPDLPRPTRIMVRDTTGKEFAHFRKELRLASCWTLGEQSITGDCIVQAEELEDP